MDITVIDEIVAQLWPVFAAQLGTLGISIAGIIGMIIYFVRANRGISREIRGDNYVHEIKREHKALSKKVDEQTMAINELVKENRRKDQEIAILIDKLAKCEGYTDEQIKD